MHAPSLVPHERGNWAYVTGLAETGVLHAPSLAQTCIQVTKQEELDEICIPWPCTVGYREPNRRNLYYSLSPYRRRPHPAVLPPRPEATAPASVSRNRRSLPRYPPVHPCPRGRVRHLSSPHSHLSRNPRGLSQIRVRDILRARSCVLHGRRHPPPWIPVLGSLRVRPLHGAETQQSEREQASPERGRGPPPMVVCGASTPPRGGNDRSGGDCRGRGAGEEAAVVASSIGSGRDSPKEQRMPDDWSVG
jgi:hypothetical protein